MVRSPSARRGSRDQAIPVRAGRCRTPQFFCIVCECGDRPRSLSGSPITPSAIYKEVGAALSSVLYRGQKSALPAKSQTKTNTFRGRYPPGDNTSLDQPCVSWKPPYPCVGHYSPPSPSAGWSLPVTQLLLAGLCGPLKAHVVAASFTCFRRP